MSLAWYTSLEQGRDIRVSGQVLEGIARALHLEPDERTHLWRLAHPERPPSAAPAPETVSPARRQMLAALGADPALLTGRRWDVLAWNDAARVVLGDFAAMPVRERNTVWRMFTNAAIRRWLVDWESPPSGSWPGSAPVGAATPATPGSPS